MGDNRSEISFHSYSIPERNYILGKLSHYITDELAYEYTSRGYSYKSKKIFPLKDKKKVPLKYKDQEGSEHYFKLGKTIGTKIEIKYEEAKVDTAIVEVSTDSHLKNALMVIFAILFLVTAYAITIYFYEFWIIVFVTLFICFCLTFLLAILPGLVGLIVGALLGWGLSYLLTPKSSKEANRSDIAYLKKQILAELRELRAMHPPGTGPSGRPPRQGPPMGQRPRMDMPPQGRRMREGPPPDRRMREGPPPERRRMREGPPPDRRMREGSPPPGGSETVIRGGSDDDFWDDDF